MALKNLVDESPPAHVVVVDVVAAKEPPMQLNHTTLKNTVVTQILGLSVKQARPSKIIQ